LRTTLSSVASPEAERTLSLCSLQQRWMRAVTAPHQL
jgi:hypothetical protein